MNLSHLYTDMKNSKRRKLMLKFVKDKEFKMAGQEVS